MSALSPSRSNLTPNSECEEKFAKAFRCSPHPFTLSTVAEDRYLDVNVAFELTTGYTREEAIGHTVPELRLWIDYSERGKLVEKILRGELIRNVECRFRRKNGEIFIGLLSAELIELGGEMCVIANVIDITEWKRTQEALNASLQRASLYFTQTMFGVIEWDRNGCVLEWNPVSEIIFGYSREEALGRHARELVIPPAITDKMAATFRLLLDRAGGQLAVNENLRKDGRTIVCEWFSTPLLADDGSVTSVLSLVHDVTARIQAERELRELSGRLITAQEQERLRLAREIHDGIGQELAVVSIQLDVLQSSAGNSTWHEKLGDIRDQVHRIASEMSALSHSLHPSILKHGGIEPALKTLCDELTRAHRITIDLNVMLPSRLPDELELCLYRVVQEALHNVVAHSRALHARVLLSVVHERVSLTVQDDGVGFDVGQATRGLGLVSMRERLRLHAGELTINSQLHGGTTIEAQVPLS